jgi:DNA-binding CsgD family transcriptional regulator
MSQRGLHLVAAGAVDTGMALLDEALAAVAGGEVHDLISIGAMYCKMLVACELTSDARRAEDWLVLAERFVARTGRIPISAICRTHYGGVLVAAGRWVEAEDELATAVRLYERSYRALRAAALARLGALRVRQGRWAEADELLADGEHDTAAVHPRAELHLARGEVELAGELARRFLREHAEAELHGPLLLLLVRIELECGDGPAAVAVTRRLRDAADGQPAGLLRALAEHAAGLVARADRAPEAVGHLETALGLFGRLGLPLEEGRVRLDLAAVLVEPRPVVATAEARAALETFRRLGAARDVDAATSLLRRLGVHGHSGPRGNGTLTVREEEVLALLGEGRGNTDIAAVLHLSRRTVEHHVSNILAKLGLTGRAEVGAYVARRRG